MHAGAKTNRIFLLLAALLFSTGGAAIKMAALTGWQIACYRAGIAAAFLWLALPNARQKWSWRTFAAGVVYAAMVVLFVLSNKLTTAANAILLQSTYPLYLLLLGPLFLKEKLRMTDLAVVAGVGLGVILLFSGTENPVATAPNPVRGNIVALASGLAWALTIAMLRWAGKRDPGTESAESIVIAGNGIAFLACLPLVGVPRSASPAALAVVIYLGLVQVGLGYYFLTRSIRHVPAVDAGMLLLTEPVLSPVWAWIIHNERPSALAIVGGLTILASALAGILGQIRDR
jgi:drug/metabolite transporter (DMT)-like permease